MKYQCTVTSAEAPVTTHDWDEEVRWNFSRVSGAHICRNDSNHNTECDTSVVLVCRPRMVVVVSGRVTSSPWNGHACTTLWSRENIVRVHVHCLNCLAECITFCGGFKFITKLWPRSFLPQWNYSTGKGITAVLLHKYKTSSEKNSLDI